ncbi:Gfo/Idh/MocA family oxidoreductase [Maribellus sp. YY47]|uniref:Gfo/Idh/MocA family protein n=1 Tax=Maribellus sp. YY47 TaxID=2929486 RepID=UPI002001509E|nr:Gfo/Idh/MocA family oxidoreductase [Maribellus sp. YY47]MCK3685738.1 Gfo/Idh/MocA family oxidoreductase [Maribellus sp. YY47]
MSKVIRRDFLKGMAAVPFLGYFAFAFKGSIGEEAKGKSKDIYETLKINKLDATGQKLLPPTGMGEKPLRIGVVGNGWRGEQLLRSLGFTHPDFVEKNTIDGKYTRKLEEFLNQEDLNVEFAAVCDTFDVRTQRAVEIAANDLRPGGRKTPKPVKIFSSYREMVKSNEVDAIIVATPDHTHALIAIEAAKAGKHVYLEKPMTHTIEEAVELRNTIKSTGVVFQLGHENRQQMSFKIARELYQKGVLGDVSMVQTFTNRNNTFGAWIRDEAFDHKLGNESNINWKEFLAHAPWHEFDLKRYFSWQRYSDYGTSVTGNDFSHSFDCVNQVLELGIPETVVAIGGQHYYKTHGDMPDVMNAIFHYPNRKLTLTYDCSLKNSIYRQAKILGSEATMDVDRAIMIYKDGLSERYRDIKANASDPMYYYEPNTGVDAISSATSQAYLKGGYGPTYIDGQVVDATLLHLKEWVDAIRGKGETSCNVDVGFEEAVTFNLANLAYDSKRPVKWDAENEKAIIL